MLSEIVLSPTPPGLVVGLLVGHVTDQVGLPADVHFNHNQQSTELSMCLVCCEFGAGWTVSKILMIVQVKQAHPLTPLMDWYP